MNVFNCNIPDWFMGIDITLELLFVFVTLAIAFSAYKAYKVIKQREVLLFGIAFFSMAIGYLQEVIFNSSQMFGFNSSDLSPLIGPVANSLNLGFFVGLIHMAMFILGLSILVYIILPKRNKKLFGIIAGLAFIGLFTSGNILLTSFLINSLMLFALTLHHYQLFLRKKTESSLFNFIGFGAIFLGQFQLAMSTTFSLLYVASHITTLFGFILLLLNLIRVQKK